MTKKATMWVKKVNNFWRFCHLNTPCLWTINITLILMKSSSIVYFTLCMKTQRQMSIGFWPPYLCPSQDTIKHDASIQNFVNLAKTSQTWLLVRLFVYHIYLLSFLRFWTFCIDWFPFLFLMAWQWNREKLDALGKRGHRSWTAAGFFSPLLQ